MDAADDVRLSSTVSKDLFCVVFLTAKLDVSLKEETNDGAEYAALFVLSGSDVRLKPK
jgi:hypothetical protein